MTPNGRMTPEREAEIRARDALFVGPLMSTAREDRRALLSELDAVRAERDGARKAINEYGIHRHWCNVWLGASAGACNCGLSDAAAGKTNGRSSDSAASNEDGKPEEVKP